MSYEYRLLHPDERTVALTKAESVVELIPGERLQVSIAHVNNPNDFHVVREEDTTRIAHLNARLTQIAAFGLPAYHPMVNQVPIAMAEVQRGEWSRVKILSLDLPSATSGKTRVSVYAIDSGMHENFEPKDLRAVPEWALDQAAAAIHCSVGILPRVYSYYEATGELVLKQEGGQWAPSVTKSLAQLGKYETATDLTAFMGLEARCICKKDDLTYIDLRLRGKSVSWSSMLVQEGVADWSSEEFRKDGDAEQVEIILRTRGTSWL